jgi:hypothetical protein
MIPDLGREIREAAFRPFNENAGRVESAAPSRNYPATLTDAGASE